MKHILNALCLTVIVSFVASAQDTTTSAKIDTMLIYQRAMLDLQKRTLAEVQYEEPLAGKHAGIELDLAYILYSSARDYFTIPATVSFFDVSRSAELAFPIFYQHGTRHENGTFGGSPYDIPLTLLDIDAAWRQFIGKHQEGLYFSGGLRYTYIKGVGGNGVDLGIVSINLGRGSPITVSKVGMFFGLGYRVFTQSGFYWGTGLTFGRYFSDDVRDVQEVTLDDSKLILDVEILKFGYAF